MTFKFNNIPISIDFPRAIFPTQSLGIRLFMKAYKQQHFHWWRGNRKVMNDQRKFFCILARPK